MDANGKWVVLIEDETFDRRHNDILEIENGIVRDSTGAEGTVELQGDKLILSLTSRVRFILNAAGTDADTMQGMRYDSDEPLPPGDPAKLWAALDDADPDDGRFDALPICDPVFLIRDEVADAMFANGPSKYAVIDVSMYSVDEMSRSGFLTATSDAEVEVALRSLPLAKVALNPADDEEYQIAAE